MAVLEGGTSTSLAEVGAAAAQALHATTKPVPHGALGHYWTSHRCAIVASQAANSRLFEMRNTHATNLMVLTHVRVQVVQTAAHTAAIEDSVDMYKATSFSVVDTTNTVTPVISVMRTAGMAVVGSSIAAVRGVTVAGAATGMTGGTLTKDTAPAWQVPIWLLALVPTAGPTVSNQFEYMPDTSNGEHPWVFAQNEGFIIENRVLLGVAAGSSVYIDVGWAEVTAY